MSIQANFPAIKPTLLLDFANTEALDPRITFTRASTGTYYDGKTVAKAEENLQIQSQDFDNASWTKGNVTVVGNSAIAPDGTSTADTLDEGTATNYHNVTGRTAQVGTNTISVFAKNISAQYVILTLTNGSGTYCFAVYDTVAGTVANSAAAGSGYSISATSITSVGNGWYRCVMTCVMPSTGEFNIGLSSSTTIGSFGLSSYTGTSRQMYIWGAQLEQRAQATAYTPTTTQPVTNYIPVLQTAASGVPRFEHNPVTGESLGLEIEEQRTNLVTYSSDFDNAAWTKNNATVNANAAVAPDGTLSADAIIPSATSSTKVLLRTTTMTASSAMTLSVYAKAAGYNFLILRLDDSSVGVFATFNISNGSVSNAAAVFGAGWTAPSASITDVGNGWYRCTLSAVSNASTSIRQIAFVNDVSTNQNGSTFTGNGFSGVYLWGAQLETGAFATSYIPTVASQVTRAADSASMTGANFSSWYRQDEGSFYAEATAAALSSTAGNPGTFVGISDGTVSNRLRLKSENGTAWEGAVAGTSQFAIGTYGSAGVSYKLAGAYKVNDFAYSFNGTTAATDTLGTVPVVSQMQIGNLTTAREFNGTIRKITYYPARVTNAQLQALTS